MKSILGVLRSNADVVMVLLIYAVSFTAFKLVTHIGFDASPLGYYWQFIDTQLLKNDLLRSLWYMHSQPPLMNYIAGLALKISESNAGLILAALYFLVGAAAVIWLNGALARLNIRRWLRMGICAFLCIHPSFFLYENWAYTTHLEFSLCCAVFYVIAGIFRAPQFTFKQGIWLFVPFTLMGLLRPQWHLVFIVGVGVLVLLLLWKRAGKIAFIKGGIVALSPLVALYVKNAVMFGFFGASSWTGMNLAQITSVLMTANEWRHMRQEQLISPNFPVSFDLNKADRVRESYIREGKDVIMLEHPALDKYRTNHVQNQNYSALLEGTKQDMRDSITIISYLPKRYLSEVMQRMVAVSHLPSSFGIMGPAGSNDYQKWAADWKKMLSIGTVIFYVVCPFAVLGLSLRRGGYIAEQRNIILVGMAMAFFIAVTSSAFTYGGESERMRWGMEPFYLAFMAILLEGILQAIRHTRHESLITKHEALISLPLRRYHPRRTCHLLRRFAGW